MTAWEILIDCNDEDGAPTCWVKEINHCYYGKFAWITKNHDGKFDVEINKCGDYHVLKTCKSLSNAQRWVTKNL